MPTDPRSDDELIALANAGGEGGRLAFEVLYHRHRDWVYGLALRFTHEHDLALDVTQEVFIYFLRKFPGFALTAKLTTFFYPAVKNLAIAQRDKARRFAGGDEALASLPDDSSSRGTMTGGDAGGGSGGGGDSGELAGILGCLSPGHREVVLLRFVDGLSMQEIAAALSLPVGTVKSRLHHALAMLREDPAARRFFEESG